MAHNSTAVNGDHNSSNAQLIVDTAAFNDEDFNNFISLNEEIERTERLRRSHRRSHSTSATIKATMTREEIFECSTLDDDQFLTALEYQNSYEPCQVSKSNVDISQSIENLMRYFDEDVPVDCRSHGGTPTKITNGKVAAVVANFRTKTVDSVSPSLTPVRKHQPEVRANIKELKKKYESPKMDLHKSPRKTKSPHKSKSPKMLRKSKVKQMAQMFNAKITQIVRRDSYAPLQNELSPEAKAAPKPIAKPRSKLPTYRAGLPSPVPSPRMRRKQAQKTTTNTCFVAEDVFRELSVKDKALLYSKFIGDMSKKNPKFTKHGEVMQENVKKEFARGEVINEKQETVKHLAQELEAKFTFPKQRISPTALQRINSMRDCDATLPQNSALTLQPSTLQPKAKEAEDVLSSISVEYEGDEHENEDALHVSTLTVVLKPSPDAKKRATTVRADPSVLPRKKRDVRFLNSLGIIEPTHKRNNEAIRSSVSIEAYAPPKKIRRTRAERLAPKMFFQNQHLERLFYSWLKEKNGVSFDITAVGNVEETIIIGPEKESSGISLDEETQKSAVDKLLEEAIAKLETVEAQTKQKEENSVEEKEIDTTITPKDPVEDEDINKKVTIEVELPIKVAQPIVSEMKIPVGTPRKKRHAPPIPGQATLPAVNPCSESSVASSAKQSDAEESESGVSSNPKITSDESQPEHNEEHPVNNNGNDFEFVKPVKPPRKKKMRRTLTWKKENSIIESKPVVTTDSDSDYKPSEVAKKSQTLPLSKSKKITNHAKRLFFRSGSVTPISPSKTPQPQEPSFAELDKSLLRVMNSPRKIKSAYTLTIMSSPSPHTESDYCESDMPRTPCRETSRSWPSLVAAVEEQTKLPDEKAASTEMTTTSSKPKQPEPNPRLLIDSFIDQGFETGSNDICSPKRLPSQIPQPAPRLKIDKTVSPLFIKLKSELEKSQSRLSSVGLISDSSENPSGFSTPVKGHVQQTFTCTSGAQQQLFSPIALTMKSRRRSVHEAESRRSSLAMQVIREDHPLDSEHNQDQQEASSPNSINDTEGHFFANAPTVDMSSNLDDIFREKTSSFWICVGDFTITMDVFHNSADRLRLLYDIFSQKSAETRDLHFGIDDHKFSIQNPADKEEISKRLPKMKGCSHYWFSTGDLAVPFSGKYMSSEKIKKVFNFISETIEDNASIRFGVDSVEFSNVPEFWQSSPKFSIESSYNMLVGLQCGNSNGLEGRSKYAWPNSMCASNHSNLIKTSDLDHSEFESEDLENCEMGRLSFSPFGSNYFDLASLGSEDLMMPRNSDAMMMSPEMFTLDYENEPLDQLFADAKKYNVSKSQTDTLVQEKKLTVPEMIETLQTQKSKLKSVEHRIRSYANPSSLSSAALEQFQDSPHYVRKLQGIIAAIDNIGRDDGFKACSMEQLESFMFFLSRYADICLANCSDHMNKILDALMDNRAVVV